MQSAQRVAIYGHRGASAYFPENSLAAFALAFEQGADGIECDAHVTADGQIVLIHDDTVDATTDGHGEVRWMSLAQIRQLTLRARNGAAQQGEVIPTLVELVEHFGNNGHLLNVEIKPYPTLQIVQAVGDFLAEHPARERVLLSSFDHTALRYLRDNHPHLRRALLLPSSEIEGILARLTACRRWIHIAKLIGCEAIHPHWRLATRSMIRHAHKHDLRVHAWTVDDSKIAASLVSNGIDGIITNDPARLRDELGLAKNKQPFSLSK
jgi:glycerophosphoryl diester phosphodiesterase